ncbi:uncharacterized protein LOC132760117 isoform X2 [Ruditapes philippinarum]|uniref:uncharacterized protein LOC132760117 isoform X2 n=1 Tax=Ruditapes philippinarum TaxID=129788 RepID=UPI00295A5994|nr:uncharacterized protein LOC132760117 isoform X2 [Ruditapes philippinarum]
MKSELLSSVRGKYTTVILTEKERDVTSVVSKHVVRPEQICIPTIEKFDNPPVTKMNTSFLEINEIIVTEHDRQCERALLDSPMVNGYSSNISYSESPLPLPGRHKLEMPSFDKCLISAEKKEILIKKLWQSQKYCDEIQASRIPEPDLSNEVEDREHAIKQSKMILKVKSDTSTGTSDLKLNWEISRYTEEITDSCKLIVPFCKDNIIDDEPLKDVEPIEKFSSRDLYDWKDEEIPLKDGKDKKIGAAAEKQVRCLKPQKITGDVNQEPMSIQTFSDPLGNFMVLRSKKTAEKSVNQTKENSVCDTKLHEPEKNFGCDRNQVVGGAIKLKQNFESKKRAKHHVVKIKLSEDYQHILDILESASENCINVLKQAAEISQSCTFKTITPDISRYLLKQKEKSLADHDQENSSDELYKMTVILHGLVMASEITVNCCLESGIGCLSALQEKYKHVIGSNLDSTRQVLFELKAQFYEKKIYHPKVVTLCREIETWLKKKRAKTKDSEQKILVLVQRDIPSLLSCLKKALNLGNLLSPCILSSSESEHIIDSLDKHNCVIAPTKMVCENFPWAQFSLVVEYENETSSQWQQLCERQHIRHIGLCIQSDKHKDTTTLTLECPEEQICLIGSQKVVQSIELLQLLETRHNILLLVRDYSLIGGAKHLFFSDIDVDASTGIVLEDIKDLNDDCAVQNLVTKMVALSLKYVNCWLILFANTKTGSYQYPGHVINNIGRLQAAVANFVDKSSYFKILFCEGCSEVSSIVRSISENCMALSKTKEQWLDRTWLRDEIQQDERALLMLPCLSSFSSQLLLKKLPLGRIFKSSMVDLQRDVSEIPSSILQTLDEFVRSNTGLHLQVDTLEDQLYDQCDNTTSLANNVVDGVENSDSQIKESLSQDQNENDEVSRDMYVSEDFQRKGRTTRYYSHQQLHTAMKNIPALPNEEKEIDAMLCAENKQSNETDKNNKICIDDQSKHRIRYNYSSAGRTEDSKENNFDSDAKFRKIKNTKENIHRSANDRVEWEHLDNFISSNTNVNRLTTCNNVTNEIKSDKHEYEISKMQNERYLNPVEKLTAMKESDRLKKSESDEKYHKYMHTGKDNNNESRYFVGEAMSINNSKYLSSYSAANYPRNHSDSTEHIPLENKRNEMLANGIKTRKAISQEMKQNLYKSNVSYPVQPKQISSWSSNSTQTFDYNHGLPFNVESLAVNEGESNSSGPQINSLNGTSRNQLGYVLGCKVQNSRSDLEKEFPPSDEIDRSIFNEKSAAGPCKYTNVAGPCKYTSNDGIPVVGRPHVYGDTDRQEYHYLPNSIDNRLEQKECQHFQNDDDPKLSRINTNESQFVFRPKIVDNSTDRRNANSEHVGGKDLVWNPNLERITRKPQCLEEHPVKPSSSHTQSLADDLRETTRKLLANSQQFSRFDTRLKRHPLQKVSIGLATPRVRNYKNQTTEVLQTSENEHRMMEQSPWATDDSPPMDLDYENSEISRMLQNESETSNRVIYTNQTPRKKRKLTYQFVPGKGQTKLVFK